MALKVVVLLLCAGLQVVYCISGDFSCIGTCYSGRVAPESQDIFRGKHLKGYSYKNITTDNLIKCYSSCVQDCRCKACQMQDERCELLEEDKSSQSSDFVDAARYVYYDIKQTLYHGAYHMLPPGKCHNGCCRSQPCMNGGTCTEHCQDPKNKFTCKCSSYFTGKVCEKYTSCLSVLKAMPNVETPPDGVYDVLDSNTKKTYLLYCHFRLIKKRVWTLIESFSLAHNAKFRSKSFYDASFSVNSHSPPSWDEYRLSPDGINYVRSNATLFRASCGYPNQTDSKERIVGRLAEFDITAPMGSGQCRKYFRITIRNHNCYECTAATYMHPTEHFHLDTSYNTACSYRPSLKHNANYFGAYTSDQVDSLFACTSSAQSTTQWWLGQEYQ